MRLDSEDTTSRVVHVVGDVVRSQEKNAIFTRPSTRRDYETRGPA